MAFSFHLAQVNVARMLAPLIDPVMAGFVARLAEINHLAESPDALKQFICRTSHKQLLAAREVWFRRFEGRNVARWWIPARARLEYLREHDDSPHPFRFPSEFAKAAVA